MDDDPRYRKVVAVLRAELEHVTARLSSYAVAIERGGQSVKSHKGLEAFFGGGMSDEMTSCSAGNELRFEAMTEHAAQIYQRAYRRHLKRRGLRSASTNEAKGEQEEILPIKKPMPVKPWEPSPEVPRVTAAVDINIASFTVDSW